MYRENHSLAINLLVGCLEAKLTGYGYTVGVEVGGRYGRPDVVIRPMRHGVLVCSGHETVLVEVKSNSFAYSQLIRYLIDWFDAVIMVWRVLPRQIFTIDAKLHMWLLQESMKSALVKGQMLLKDCSVACGHRIGGTSGEVRDADALVNDFLSALRDTLPTVVDKVCQLVKGRMMK